MRNAHWCAATFRSAMICLATFCAVPAFAQSNESAPRQRLITLNFAAVNSRDEPVTDLKLEDIQLREDGKPRPIVFFRFDRRVSTMAPPAPGEFANHAAASPVVILLDRWNERLVLSSRSGIELGTALQHLETVGNVYIYFLTNRAALVPVHPLPATDGDLRAATNPSPAELRAELDQGILQFQGFRSPDDLDVRVDKTLQGLGMLAARMSALGGRKSLIWVTQGIPLMFWRNPTIDMTPQVRSLSEMAAQAQIEMYTVDQTNGVGASELSRTLQLFSSLTGGRWYARDNAAIALTGALTDARGGYRIAYYSAAPERNGKEYKVRLDTPRKGVHLLTREGFTVEPGAPNPDQLEALRIHNQIDSPFDAAEIGLRVAMSPRQQTGAVHFNITVDPADVLMERSGDGYRAQLDVLGAFYSDGFPKGTSPAARMDLRLTQAQLDRGAKEGIVVPLDLPLADGIQKVRVIVFNPGLQALGSVTISTK